MTHHFKVINRNLPAPFLRKTLHRPWMRLFVFLDDGPLSRTPEHYKKFVYEWKVVTPSPVHYIPEPGVFKKNEYGKVEPVTNYPLPLTYPVQMHEGLWGGEAIVKGYIVKKGKPLNTLPKVPFWYPHISDWATYKDIIMRYKKTMGQRPKHPKEGPLPRGNYWVPKLTETIVYSEILDKYMKTLVTDRALYMIDKHYGLDPYILQTPPCDLYTEMALKLKREMLYTLHHKSLYPDDHEKREEIYNKYKQYLIPEEEIEWYGLNLREAYRKQMKLEEADKVGPYKHIFRREFIEQLKNQETKKAQETEEQKKKSLLEKVSGFSIFKTESK